MEKDVDVPYKKGRIQKHEFATHSNGILANNLTTFQTFPYIALFLYVVPITSIHVTLSLLISPPAVWAHEMVELFW